MDKEDDRRGLLASSAVLALGAVAFGTKKAKASALGEENVLLGQLVASATQIYNSVKDMADKYNKISDDVNGVLDASKSSYNLASNIRNYEETIKKQKQGFKRFVDRFYAVKNDPLSNRIPKLRLEAQPLIAKTTSIISDLEILAGKSIKNSSKDSYAARSKARAGHTLGKVAAQEVRAQTSDLKKIAGHSPDDESTAAQRFGEQSGPIQVDQNQLILETLLRQENLLINILEALTGKPSSEVSSTFSKQDFKKAIVKYQDGKGTLL